jgi:hypothetical protein
MLLYGVAVYTSVFRSLVTTFGLVIFCFTSAYSPGIQDSLLSVLIFDLFLNVALYKK